MPTTQWDYVAMVGALVPDSANANHVLLYGPPATGKTFAANAARQHEDQPIYQVTAHEDMGHADLFGFMCPSGDGGAKHFDAPGTLAWRNHGLLVINEISEAGPGGIFGMFAQLDDPWSASMTLASGETIRPNPDPSKPYRFRCYATSNQNPEALPEALASRFAFKVNITAPSEKAVATLVQPWLREFTNALYRDPDNACANFREIRAFSHAISNHIAENDASVLVWRERAADVLGNIAQYKTREERRR